MSIPSNGKACSRPGAVHRCHDWKSYDEEDGRAGKPSEDNENVPRFIAFAGMDSAYIESADDLEELLGELVELVSPDCKEDVVIFHGDYVVAVLTCEGRVIRILAKEALPTCCRCHLVACTCEEELK